MNKNIKRNRNGTPGIDRDYYSKLIDNLQFAFGLSEQTIVLLVYDDKNKQIAIAFKKILLKKIDKSKIFSIKITQKYYETMYFPKEFVELALKAKLILNFLKDSTENNRYRVKLLKIEKGTGNYIGHGVGFDENLLLKESALFQNSYDLSTFAKRLINNFKNADVIRITTKTGTDIKLVLGNRCFNHDLTCKYGSWVNIPCGEINIAPIELKTKGIIVFDCFEGKDISDSMLKMRIKNGKIESISCRDKLIKNKIKNLLISDIDYWSDVIGLFTIGINPKAHLGINTTIDIKTLGVASFAFGDNLESGGLNPSETQHVFPLLNPTVKVIYKNKLKKIIIDNGDFYIGNSEREEKMIESAFWALKDIFKLKPKNKTLIVYIDSKKDIAKAFKIASKQIGNKVDLFKINKIYNQEKILDEISRKLNNNYDMVVNLFEGGDDEIIFRKKVLKLEEKTSAKVAHCPGISTNMLIEGPLAVRYSKIIDKVKIIKNLCKKIDKVTVISKDNSELSFSIKDRPIVSDLLVNKGEWGNLPAGEVWWSPIEGTANGKFICDGSIGGIGIPIEKIELIIKNGRLEEIHGDEDLRKKIFSLLSIDDNARNMGEFGIGLNMKAKISGNMLEDEKADHTVHIAFGDNTDKGWGGKNKSKTHLDFLCLNPTVIMHDIQENKIELIEKGEHVFEFKNKIKKKDVKCISNEIKSLISPIHTDKGVIIASKEKRYLAEIFREGFNNISKYCDILLLPGKGYRPLMSLSPKIEAEIPKYNICINMFEKREFEHTFRRRLIQCELANNCKTFHHMGGDYKDFNYIKSNNLAKINHNKLLSKLNKSENIEIISPKGTNIIFNVKNKPFFLDTDPLYNNVLSFYHGRIICIPNYQIGSGILVPDYAISNVEKITKIPKFFIKENKIINVTCTDKNLLKKIDMSIRYENANVIGYIGIGLNKTPHWNNNYAYLDYGTIHLCFGDNSLFYSGDNNSKIYNIYTINKPSLNIYTSNNKKYTLFKDGRQIEI